MSKTLTEENRKIKEKKYKSMYDFAIYSGFSPKTAKAMDGLFKFAEHGPTYKNKPTLTKEQIKKWTDSKFIEKNPKTGEYVVVLDKEAKNGDGLSWTLAGVCYEGLLEKVESKQNNKQKSV